jgi:protein-disulfide isomerase/uncharacterized membrane protein
VTEVHETALSPGIEIMAEPGPAAPQPDPQGALFRDPNSSPETAILLSLALTFLGATISFLLVKIHAGAQTLFCPSSGGCEAVLGSKYSTFAGIPLPWMGVASYLALLGFLLLALGTRIIRVRVASLGITLWLAVAGASFSSVLMFLQFFVLRGFCPLCTVSAGVMALLVFTIARADKNAGYAGFTGRSASAFALGCIVLISVTFEISSVLTAGDEVLAVVDGRKFTRTQMEKEIGESLEARQRSIYQLEFDWIRKKVDESLLSNEAQARGTNVEQLLATQPGNHEQLLEELAKRHRVQVLLRAPKVRSLQIDLSSAKLAGPKNAPIQLVVFSDFQCRFCSDLAGVLKRIRAEFPEKVLVAYRYFPIEAHDRAMAAAIAAECAAEQGKFWEYHDGLFAEHGDLSDSTLSSLAKAVGLDPERFGQCQNSAHARQVVETSRQEAVAFGLEGAPIIALNGRIIGGTVAYEKLRAEVLEVLKAAPKTNP